MKTPGVYLLTIQLRKKTSCRTANKIIELPSGYYVYAGSAMGGLEGRLGRHFSVTESKHWHIDTLLAEGKVVDAQALPTTDKNAECELAAQMTRWPDVEVVSGFGASDCDCDSHLVWSKTRPFMTPFAYDVLKNFQKIVDFFKSAYVDHANIEHRPFETLITCVLSLRTKDQVTLEASRRLFRVLNGPDSFVETTPERIEKLIFPVGMYREKAKRLIEISRQLIERYDGRVPPEIDELLTLPGVGRKTANLVRSFAFHLPAICVDTHAHRISNRMALVRTVAPDDTELALRAIVPEKFWVALNPFLVQHGQQVCNPTRPKCDICEIRGFCRYDRLLDEEKVRRNTENYPPHPCLKVVEAKKKQLAGPKVPSPFE